MPRVKRVFLVGCPRSGTTLLQSLVAAHSKIASFPETHVFENLVKIRKKWLFLRIMGLSNSKSREKLFEFFKLINYRPSVKLLKIRTLISRQVGLTFLQALDEKTVALGKNIWLEKTPGNLKCIDYIQDLAKDVKFIHIVRSGSDVVASQFEASLKYPKEWRHRNTIEKCVKSWNSDITISMSYRDEKNHMIVRYENLIEDTEGVMRNVFSFIGVEFEEEILLGYAASASNVILPSEKWKSNVGDLIQGQGSEKFRKVFTDREQEYILEKLKKVSF